MADDTDKKFSIFGSNSFKSVHEALEKLEELFGEETSCIKAMSLMNMCELWLAALKEDSLAYKAFRELSIQVAVYGIEHLDMMLRVKAANNMVEQMGREAKQVIEAMIAAEEEERNKGNEHDPELH